MPFEEYDGSAKLFPLPDLVMFPHVVQPLYIFEPRYLELLEDALADDQIIAMALLRSGWETRYEDDPPIHDTVCLGEVVSHVKNDDGTYNILLAGMSRARIVQEIDNFRMYREAEIEVFDEAHLPESAEMRTALTDKFRHSMADSNTAEELISRVQAEGASLSTLVDIISFTLPLGIELKQYILAEENVENRAQILISNMTPTFTADAGSPGYRKFPPDFSLN